MNEQNNGQDRVDGDSSRNHSHALALETITVTFDPNHGQLHYDLQNMDYATAIQRLELAQMFLFDNLKRAQTVAKEIQDVPG